MEIVRKHGGVFICDEVQTGFGRTGKHMFGIEHWGVEPEIMTMAKGIANGMPLAVCIATPEIADAFQQAHHLHVRRESGVVRGRQRHAGVIEQGTSSWREPRRRVHACVKGLEELQRKRFPKKIGDVRGKGLMQAIELVVDETAGDRTRIRRRPPRRLFEETRKRGLLIGKGGLARKLRSNLPAADRRAKSEIDEALSALRRVLSRQWRA